MPQRTVPLFLSVLVLLTSFSCTTYRWQAELPEVVDAARKVPKFVKIDSTARRNHFKVTNLTDDMVTVSYRQSVIQVGDSSLRAISGETRGINTDRDSPDIVIAPRTASEISLYSEDSDKSQKIVRGTLRDVKFRIAMKLADKPMEYAIISGEPSNEFTTEASQHEKMFCYLTGLFYGGYCWFIRPSEDDRAEAKRRAEEIFNTKVKEIRYLGRQ